MQPPKNLAELFEFYRDYVRILYAAVQAQNELPQEVLFEINVAFDHVSRIYTHGHAEAEEVVKAYSHLKRSCLDIFKLKVKETVDNYHVLQKIDTSIIDNGDFDRKMHQKINEIRQRSVQARQSDAATEHDDGAGGFTEWVDVYDLCSAFDRDFFRNQHVPWARSKQRMFTLKHLLWSIGVSIISGFLVALFFS